MLREDIKPNIEKLHAAKMKRYEREGEVDRNKRKFNQWRYNPLAK
jgi:hypothetical protein